MHQFVKETSIANRESVFGCIASFLKGEYFEGKRDFIDNLSGLVFLREAFLVSQDTSLRLQKRLLLLIYDLILSDDQLFPDNKTHIRGTLADDEAFVQKLVELIASDSSLEDLYNHQKFDKREAILKILEYLVNYKHHLLSFVTPVLDSHHENIKNTLEKGVLPDGSSIQSDFNTYLNEELSLIQRVKSSVGKTIRSNFDEGEEFKPVLSFNQNSQQDKEEEKKQPLAIGI